MSGLAVIIGLGTEPAALDARIDRMVREGLVGERLSLGPALAADR